MGPVTSGRRRIDSSGLFIVGDELHDLNIIFSKYTTRGSQRTESDELMDPIETVNP
jgi:hypothetical protein